MMQDDEILTSRARQMTRTTKETGQSVRTTDAARRSSSHRRPLEQLGGCYYCYYMKRVELKVARIGNSRGVRIPAATLERYRIGDSVVMEERSEGILLRPRHTSGPKLSWEDTAAAMSAESEDWSDWDAALADGLGEISWRPSRAKRVAESKRVYPERPKRTSGK
jgi:antitoxin component of MazEF toxin-antitoxin module